MTDVGVRPVLERVATAAGTLGLGLRRWEAYLEACECHREFRVQAGIVGTDEWRTVMDRNHLAMLQGPDFKDVVALWSGDGVPIEEVANRLTAGYERHLQESAECFNGVLDDRVG